MPDGHENLPARPETALEEDIVEGEIVDEPPERQPLPVVRVVQVVIRHEHTRTTGRHLGYIPRGFVVVVRRLWDSRSTARYERMIRAAEAAGNHEAALQWDERRSVFLRDRHGRRMDWIDVPGKVAQKLVWIGGSTVGVLGATGIFLAIAEKRAGAVAEPFEVVARVVEIIVIVISVGWGPFLVAAPWLAMAALWHVGRKDAGAMTGGWSAQTIAGGEDGGLVVTADAIVLALQHLPMPALAKAFKDGWRPTFHTTPVRDGEGYFSVFNVPLGVTAEMIADKTDVLARNLHRSKTEVWPTDAERDKIAPAGYVALWVANPGVLDRPAPEWPLLNEGTADVFKGVPAGVSPRGDAISVPVVANNFAIGGMMGQGKSNACRVIMLGAALDPLAELQVHVFAYNGDFDAFGPRLSKYVKGAEEAQLTEAMDTLHGLYEEVGYREQRISDIGAKKVTRDLAMRYPDLRPKLTLFSECHELFGDKQFGDEATELAVDVIRRARKCAMWMGFDTQDSRKDAIPPKLVNLVSVNGCFYVKGWQANDGFLGAGSFRAGIRATELRPGRDIGRSLITGVSNAQFEILKWHYIFSDDDTGQDDAAPVIARAMKNLAPGTITGSQPAAIVVRDLLGDVAEVIDGPDRVRVNDLPNRLRKLAPTWGEYRNLTGRQLRERLTGEGVKTTNTDNKPELDPADLHRVIADRERDE